jgi:outer membrane protein
MREPHNAARHHRIAGGSPRTMLALVTCLVVSAAAAQTPADSAGPELTLAAALREIAGRSTAAISAELDRAAAREDTTKARAPYLPSVSLSGGHFDRDDPIVAIFGTFQAPTTDRNYFTGQLDVTELLWDGGRRPSALTLAEHSETATERGGEANVRAAQLDGMGTYLQILVLKAQRQVVAERVRSLEDHLRVARDLFDNGVVARNDLLETEVRLRVVQDQASRVDDDEAVAIQALDRLLGRRPGTALTLPDSLPSPPPLPVGLDELESRVADHNPQLLSLRARLEAEAAAVAVRKAAYYPTAIARFSHTYEQNSYMLYSNANVLFLGLSWQAYDGGSRRADMRIAELTAARTREEITDLERRLAIQVDQAYRGYRQALREAATARVNVQATEENLRIEEDRYKAGLVTTIDVLDAESVLAESRFSLANQHYAAYLKQGILLSLAGEDLPAFYAAATGSGEEH